MKALLSVLLYPVINCRLLCFYVEVHFHLHFLQIIFKQIIRKNFGGIVAEIWEKMRDNLKVVFFFWQTFLKHYSMHRRERMRIFGSLRAYYSVSLDSQEMMRKFRCVLETI